MTSNNDPHIALNPSRLSGVSELKQPPTQESFLRTFQGFLATEGILEEWEESDVVLEAANGDEVFVGDLTSIERKWFCIGQLVQQHIRLELVEIEASQAELVTRIMRERRISGVDAIQVIREEHADALPEDQHVFLNMANICATTALSTFEFDVRSRLDLWSQPMIVRKGFRLHTYA